MWKAFIAVLAISVLAELFIEKQPHFGVERFFASYALYGFIACAALILVSKAIGAVLKRPDSYYDDE
jgi:hypothetical protein